ncbi:MAG: zinc ribbon domain-containing protein [Candidatus Lokiarchaeota archaeon]|nr:zinc ribbon domain-containing protein [Candidatus Lokiarchaeota archaeon]
MPQNMFPFDMFGFMSGFFILIFVIAIIFFVIVILIVYKLLHSNVDNIKKKSVKVTSKPADNINNTSNENTKKELVIEKEINICKYCGEKIEDTATFCPFCGSNLTD